MINYRVKSLSDCIKVAVTFREEFEVLWDI